MTGPLDNGSVREQIVDTSTGFIIKKQQDCEGMIQAIHSLSDKLPKRASSQKYLGSVPTIIAIAWANEWGVRPFSREWLTKARHRLKNDPNWSKLRIR